RVGRQAGPGRRAAAALVGGQARQRIFRGSQPVAGGGVRAPVRRLHGRGGVLAAVAGPAGVRGRGRRGRRAGAGQGAGGTGGGAGGIPVRPVGQQRPGPLPAAGIIADDGPGGTRLLGGGGGGGVAPRPRLLRGGTAAVRGRGGSGAVASGSGGGAGG